MVCRDAVVQDGIAIARVWVAAWQAAYAGLMPAEYLAGLNADAVLPGFESRLRANPSALVLELDGEIVGFSAYDTSRDSDSGPKTGEVFAINLHPSCWRRGLGRELLRETQQRLGGPTAWVRWNDVRQQWQECNVGWRSRSLWLSCLH
jgi:ribosomal protein S18 acetylase RimI-like enzyme